MKLVTTGYQRRLSPRGIAAVVGMFLLPAFASAAFPEVTHQRPLGIRRGEETTVTYYGRRLGDAYDALCHEDGVEVLEVKPVKENAAEVRFKVSPTIGPGLVPIQLVTRSGIANARLLGIGTLPVVDEKEPNQSLEEAQPVDLPVTVEGVIEREDVDCFRVNLKAGETVRVEIEGIRILSSARNRNLLDPYVAILDQDRFEVAVSDDSALLQQDSVCSFTPEKSGVYTVLVRDSAFLGDRNICGYRLHIGRFPRPAALFPPAATAGTDLDARWIDVDGSVHQQKFSIPEQAQGSWPVVVETADGLAPSPNRILVTRDAVVTEQEPNDDHRKAPLHEAPAVFCGVIAEAGDQDCFSFTCKKGASYRVKLHAREPMRSPLDGVIHVFGPDHRSIQSSDDVGGSPDGSLDFRASADGVHTVRVMDHLRSGSPLHVYAVQVQLREPSFDLELNELRRYETTVVAVPAGGYNAVVVRARRDRFGEDIDLDVTGLPSGVSALTFPIPKGRSDMPLLLHAKPNTEPVAALFDIKGTGKAGDRVLNGDLTQRHKLVGGQGQREMWGIDTDRAAMTVGDPAPMKIEVVQPKTPLLRRGSKELVVRVQRDEGFDGTLSIRSVWNPPGVRVDNSRRIAKDQSEVRVPITANGNAGLGEWPIVLLVNYPTKRGTATMAMAPIQLAVEEPVFNYSFPRIAGELGSEVDLTLSVEKIRDIQGELSIRLVGLPNGVVCESPDQPLTLDATTVRFPLKITEEAKPGRHRTLVVQTRITRDGEEMMQTDGNGELRIDKPLPKKVASKPKAKEAESASKESSSKAPLSRLEQLRQQKEAS